MFTKFVHGSFVYGDCSTNLHWHGQILGKSLPSTLSFCPKSVNVHRFNINIGNQCTKSITNHIISLNLNVLLSDSPIVFRATSTQEEQLKVYSCAVFFFCFRGVECTHNSNSNVYLIALFLRNDTEPMYCRMDRKWYIVFMVVLRCRIPTIMSMCEWAFLWRIQ